MQCVTSHIWSFYTINKSWVSHDIVTASIWFRHKNHLVAFQWIIIVMYYLVIWFSYVSKSYKLISFKISKHYMVQSKNKTKSSAFPGGKCNPATSPNLFQPSNGVKWHAKKTKKNKLITHQMIDMLFRGRLRRSGHGDQKETGLQFVRWTNKQGTNTTPNECKCCCGSAVTRQLFANPLNIATWYANK